VLPREKRALGDALGLTKIGVNLTTLPPGKESSMRHFHTREDELVFVLEGEVVLRTDEGEQVLTAGTCAGFPAGSYRSGSSFFLLTPVYASYFWVFLESLRYYALLRRRQRLGLADPC
jgi:uncharacterized cupin superfamily protein